MKFKFLTPHVGVAIILFFSVSCKTSQSAYNSADNSNANVLVEEYVEYEPKELPGNGVYRAEPTKVFNLIHTQLDVRFDWAKQYLHGTAVLTLKPHFYPQKQLILDAKGFDIHSVKLFQNKTYKTVEHQYDGKKLTIQLEQEYTRQQQITLEIKYTAKPNELEQNGSKAITSAKGLYFINPDGSDPNKPRQIWTQGETESSSCWFPTLDAPNQKSTQEIKITVEKNFKTLSNGLLISSTNNADGTRTDYWKMDKPHAPYLFMMAVGEFAVVKDKWQNIEVDYYVEPAYEKYAKHIFGNTPEMIQFFSEKLNYPFPWHKYSQIIVRDYVSGAMENTSASVFMEDLQMDSRQLLDKEWDYIIAHELFHQWFGDLVTCESWSNLPLNESFANYSEYLWAEYKYGVDEADFGGLNELNQYLAEATEKQEDLIRFYYDDKEDMFDSHSYAKGGRILHMLRKYVGDEAFFKSLEVYLKTNQYKDVEAHQLRLAFEEVTGEDLNWFFNQWFYAAGHPELLVEHTYQNGILKVSIAQQQNIKTTPIYVLPVFIDYWVKGKRERQYVVITDTYQEYEFKVAEQPEAILFDGEQQLLGIVEHNKSFEELEKQYLLSDKFLGRYMALEQLALDSTNTQIERVFKRALNDQFWAIREQATYFFADYQGINLTDLQASLSNLALKDPKSDVRAAAINVLADLEGYKMGWVFKQALQDSSYVVLSSALYAYYSLDLPNSREMVEGFESSNNPNVILVVGSYYLQNYTEGKLDWYLSKLPYMKSGELYYYLQLLAQYTISEEEEASKQKVMELMFNQAMNNSTYYVRMVAYQILTFFSDLDGVNDKLQQIRANEKDERLQKMFR